MVLAADLFLDPAFRKFEGKERGFDGEGGLGLLHLDLDALLDLDLYVLGDLLAFFNERKPVLLAADLASAISLPVSASRSFTFRSISSRAATARSRASFESCMDFAISAERPAKKSRIGFLV